MPTDERPPYLAVRIASTWRERTRGHEQMKRKWIALQDTSIEYFVFDIRCPHVDLCRVRVAGDGVVLFPRAHRAAIDTAQSLCVNISGLNYRHIPDTLQLLAIPVRMGFLAAYFLVVSVTCTVPVRIFASVRTHGPKRYFERE